MKKNLVIGTLLISTIVSAVAPAMAGPLERAICNLETIVTNDPSCRDRRPGPRDDRRDYRPPGGSDRVVQSISSRGEWVRLNLAQAVFVSSVEAHGFRDDVRIHTAKVFLNNGVQYDLDVRGPVARLSGRDAVAAVYVWVETREDRRDRWDRRDRRDRRDRWDRTDIEVIVNSNSGVPYIRGSR